jgi:hypothetical protein
MKIYKDGERLDLNNFYVTNFKILLDEHILKLTQMIEPDFSSITELKGKNKDILELAFNAELNESI